ncbi:MAG: hypothetical protein LBH70_10735 [Spirochaetaceae bacterium]|nr:hypothetical protein [Spirochaetaceae bacterium]
MEASGELPALPEPVFPESAPGPVPAAVESVITPVPPVPRFPVPEPLVMDDPPILDIFPEPSRESVSAPEPAVPPLEPVLAAREPVPAAVEPVVAPVPPAPQPPVLNTFPEPAVAALDPVPAPSEPAPPPAIPAPERIQAPPAAPARPPAPPPPPPPPQIRPPPAPSSESPERRRAGSPASGIQREPLPLPAAPVPNLPARNPPAPPAPSPSIEDIEYSRVVQALVGQTIEIPFRGTGWVYLGELRSRRGVSYTSRRSEPEGQTFVFLAEDPGMFGLEFYKQDYIRDYNLSDFVQVIVNESSPREAFAPPRDLNRATAPRWPYLPGEEPAARTAGVTPRAEDRRADGVPAGAALPAREPEAPQSEVEQRDGGIVPEAPPQTASAVEQPDPPESAEPSVPDDAPPEEYFRKAQEAFEGGQIQPALAILDLFQERHPLGSDEAWWLYGQFLESAGPNRDIRRALESYRRLVREYPQSPRYNDARGRIVYLERFYFNIR